MADPFQAFAVRERFKVAGALALLAAFLAAMSYLQFGTIPTNGKRVEAEVLRFGANPASGIAGGDVPIVTVRLPDGSIRDVQATWASVNGCSPGRWVSLVQRGVALQIARPGCRKSR